MVRIGFLAVWAFVLGASALPAERWERLDRCEYVEGAHSDGDSIEIRPQGKHYVFRLYFVDCVEKNPLSRVRRGGQARYFGLNGSENTALRAAYLASNFTRDKLREPFTIYTRWQAVEPGGDNPAVRAFVETAQGEDLSTLLVREGLAIIRHGDMAISDHPRGRSSQQISEDLRRVELEARTQKRGAWGLANGSEDGESAEVLPATNREGLVSCAGKRVKVRGRISRVGALRNGDLSFLNFNGNERDGFVGIIDRSARAQFLKRFPEGLKKALVGKDVVLEGVITLYRGAPQIKLDSPTQLRVERNDTGKAARPHPFNEANARAGMSFFSLSRSS
jgi:endonuclease YncB( thermonuclease family)